MRADERFNYNSIGADEQHKVIQEEKTSYELSLDAVDSPDKNYLDNDFSNAIESDNTQFPTQEYELIAAEEDDLDKDGYEDEDDLDPDDLDDDLVERYDENDRPDPETFSEDGFKID